MANETIRIGLIGAGNNTRTRHVPGFKAQPGVAVVTVANRTPASSEAVAAQLGIPRTAPDWRAVLADPEVDAVCIGTWPYTHAQMTIAALEAGKHVLCEARMAARASEAREMLRVSRDHPELVAQIVPAPHTLAVDRTIAERVADGYIGELILAEVRVSTGSFPEREGAAHWRHDRDLSGNNIMSMGIWYEAMMRWVGPAASVSAVGQTVVKHRRDADGRRVAMTIPDHVDIIGEMEQGGQLRFTVSSVIGLAPAAEVGLYGTEGTLALRTGPDGALALYGGQRGAGGLEPLAIDPAKKGAWRVEEEFVGAIRGQETVTHTDFATGVRYMEWTDAVTRSLRTGRRVHLPLEANA